MSVPALRAIVPEVEDTPALTVMVEPVIVAAPVPAPEMAPVMLIGYEESERLNEAPVTMVAPVSATVAAAVSVKLTLAEELELMLVALVVMVPEPPLLIVSVEALRVVVPLLVMAPLTAMVPPVLLSWRTVLEASEDALSVTVLEEP